MAYAEHDGKKRQRGGSHRLTRRHPRIGSINTCAPKVGRASVRRALTGHPRTRGRAARPPRARGWRRVPSRPRDPRRRDRNPARVAPPDLRSRRAGGAERDFGVPQTRRCGRARRRPVPAGRDSRRHTEARSGRVETVERGPMTRTSHGRGLARSGAEALASTLPARSQHRPPATRAHAAAEAVLLLPLPVVGLEGALHSWPPRGNGVGGGRRLGRARRERTPSVRACRTASQRGAHLSAARRGATFRRAHRSGLGAVRFPAGAPGLHTGRSAQGGGLCRPRRSPQLWTYLWTTWTGQSSAG